MINKNFMSDNVWGIHPQIIEALSHISEGTDYAYGDDQYTQELQTKFNQLFEKNVTCLPLQSGTAANGLSLSLAAGPINRVLCHPMAHLWESECGAIENYTGGSSLEFIEGENGKVDPTQLKQLLSREDHGFHQQKPSVLSIAQTTELGTVYTPDEIKILCDICKQHGLYVHMDGARLANAAALYEDLSLSELTWKLGIDILSFGFTKNGAMGAESVIVFDPKLAGELMYRAKRGGLIASKMRFISVQILTMLKDDLWRKLGKRANNMTQKLHQNLMEIPGITPCAPQESNQIFAHIDPVIQKRLSQKGFLFHDWPTLGEHCCRLICSSQTNEASVNSFIQAAKEGSE